MLPPAVLQDVMPKAQPPKDPGPKALAMDGGFSAGNVIAPPPHPDQQPWPLGMVIKPPDTKDANAIVPGTRSLPEAQRPEPEGPPEWSKRFADAVHGSISAIVGLVLPGSI